MARQLTKGSYLFTVEGAGDFTNPLAEAVEKIQREAYAQGWRDAIAALSKAAAEAAELGSDFSSGTGQVVSGVTQGSTA